MSLKKDTKSITGRIKMIKSVMQLRMFGPKWKHVKAHSTSPSSCFYLRLRSRNRLEECEPWKPRKKRAPGLFVGSKKFVLKQLRSAAACKRIKMNQVFLLLDKLHKVYVDQRKSDDVERSNLRSRNNVHDKVKALSRRATTSPHIPTIQKNQWKTCKAFAVLLSRDPLQSH